MKAIQNLTILSAVALAAELGSYNVDPNTVSVSGLSSGGYFANQLGVAYLDIFKTGFGVFAGGPFDCARNQPYYTCMYNGNPSITFPTANMRSWDGKQIAPLSNLRDRRIYMQVGTADTTVGPSVQYLLRVQLANFDTASNVKYVTTPGASHTFPTDYDTSGNSPCSYSSSPFVSNCGYDGAGAVLEWMYGSLTARNDDALGGNLLSFNQTGSYKANGMDSTGFLYVPKACQNGSVTCKLHVAMHGCKQSHTQIGSSFTSNAGYNKWADTNNIVILYPQTIVDNTLHAAWNGLLISNPNACWDWVGWYGNNADQIGGVQMVAVVNQVKRIVSGYTG